MDSNIISFLNNPWERRRSLAGAVGWGVEVLHHLDSSWTKKRLSDLLDAFGASGGDQEVRSREEVKTRKGLAG